MPRKKYLVTLSDTERAELEQLLRRGQHPSRKLTRARILAKEIVSKVVEIGFSHHSSKPCEFIPATSHSRISLRR